MMRSKLDGTPRGARSTRCVVLASALVGMAAVGCGGRTPSDLGLQAGRLADCPASPNCVASATDPSDAEHAIDALAIVGDVDGAWQAAREVVASSPGAEVAVEETGYLRAVYVSRWMRYRDDLELHLDRDARAIAVRSASRVGYGDMGVNRARVEALRAALASRGVVRPAADR